MGKEPYTNQEVELRINSIAERIEGRLENSLNTEGRIDLERLRDTDRELGEVLREYAASKTWRDDPHASARDVAKLLEAQSESTPLGQALRDLSSSLKDEQG